MSVPSNQRFPDEIFFLDVTQPEALEQYLKHEGLLTPAGSLFGCEPAGEGNMNCTVRVRTADRSFIVKQSRPWVEKYPQFEAPWDRALQEAEFYRLSGADPELSAWMPQCLHVDRKARILVLEDLGNGGDYSDLYRGGVISVEEIRFLGGFLERLHRIRSNSGEKSPLPNRAMRALNHAHIFHIPLSSDNGLDLEGITPGLQAEARRLQADVRYSNEVERLGKEVYLSDGPCLLHGDFFPGSFMRTLSGPRVIDPEFAFFGRPEFDLGILQAHLWLANHPSAGGGQLLEFYGAPDDFDRSLMWKLTGVEIMRRLLGYAQLPLDLSLSTKTTLLNASLEMVLHGEAPAR